MKRFHETTAAAIRQALESTAFRKLVESIGTNPEAIVETSDFGFSAVVKDGITLRLNDSFNVTVQITVLADVIRPEMGDA